MEYRILNIGKWIGGFVVGLMFYYLLYFLSDIPAHILFPNCFSLFGSSDCSPQLGIILDASLVFPVFIVSVTASFLLRRKSTALFRGLLVSSLAALMYVGFLIITLGFSLFF